MRFYKAPSEITIASDLLGEWGLEINLGRQTYWNWIDFVFRWDRKTDHAGLHFEIEILGFYVYINAQDSRHWNFKKDRWYLDGEEEKELSEEI